MNPPKEIKYNKLDIAIYKFTAAITTMQELIELAEKHDYPDEMLDDLQESINLLQEMGNAVKFCMERNKSKLTESQKKRMPAIVFAADNVDNVSNRLSVEYAKMKGQIQ